MVGDDLENQSYLMVHLLTELIAGYIKKTLVTFRTMYLQDFTECFSNKNFCPHEHMHNIFTVVWIRCFQMETDVETWTRLLKLKWSGYSKSTTYLSIYTCRTSQRQLKISDDNVYTTVCCILKLVCTAYTGSLNNYIVLMLCFLQRCITWW